MKMEWECKGLFVYGQGSMHTGIILFTWSGILAHGEVSPGHVVHSMCIFVSVS